MLSLPNSQKLNAHVSFVSFELAFRFATAQSEDEMFLRITEETFKKFGKESKNRWGGITAVLFQVIVIQ